MERDRDVGAHGRARRPRRSRRRCRSARRAPAPAGRSRRSPSMAAATASARRRPRTRCRAARRRRGRRRRGRRPATPSSGDAGLPRRAPRPTRRRRRRAARSTTATRASTPRWRSSARDHQAVAAVVAAAADDRHAAGVAGSARAARARPPRPAPAIRSAPGTPCASIAARSVARIDAASCSDGPGTATAAGYRPPDPTIRAWPTSCAPSTRARPGRAACCVDDAGGRGRGALRDPPPVATRRPGLVEHDAEEIWARTRRWSPAALADAPAGGARARRRHRQPARDGRRLGAGDGPADRARDRVAGRRARRTPAGRSRRRGHAALLRERTGLVVAPYFSATKLAWLLDHVDGARERAAAGELAAGTIDAWLLSRLTGRARHRRDERLAHPAGRPRHPGVGRASCASCCACRRRSCPRSRRRGRRTPTATVRDGPLAGVPVTGVLGDQQAALLGQACIDAGDAKCTYGTGSFLLAVAGERPRALGRGPAGLAGAPGAAGRPGAATAWRAPSRSRAAPSAGWSTSSACWRRPPSRPTWRPACRTPAASRSCRPSRACTRRGGTAAARGTIVGLSLHSTRAHVVRATLESIAYLTRAVVEALEADVGVPLRGAARRRRHDGERRADAAAGRRPGPARWCGSRVRETTALGAAFAAGPGRRRVGRAGRRCARWCSRTGRSSRPGPPTAARQGWATWQRAVERARGWEA